MNYLKVNIVNSRKIFFMKMNNSKRIQNHCYPVKYFELMTSGDYPLFIFDPANAALIIHFPSHG